ncbi:MAG: hypothetical protein R2798_07045 [Chitinophagales bacterium]|nr:hypothetical protein [Bacteroidota bacterium]
MKKIKLFPILAIVGLLFQLNVVAQIDVCLHVENQSIFVSAEPLANYSTAPFNFWNSTVFTIRYPQSASITWSNFQKYTNLNIVEDTYTATPIDGGDGYYYKMFSSADVAVIQNFTNGTSLDLFSIDFSSANTVTFELVNSNTWTTANNGDIAINNATSGNTINAVVTSCGSQMYDAGSSIVDNDNDGVDSTLDPNDSDPCVPNCNNAACTQATCFQITIIK